MATKNKKIATAVTAVTLAAVLAIGGTMAWQSISQEATNIVTAEVNPGGRLHDDFDGSNDKNIYVENFGTQNIYARVKLSEYLEVGPNAGNLEFDQRSTYLENRTIEILAGDDLEDTTSYATYQYEGDNVSDQYWTKEWGGQTNYIPTFNRDHNSLKADLNGTYDYMEDVNNTPEDTTDDVAAPYKDYVDYNQKTIGSYSETDTLIESYDNEPPTETLNVTHDLAAGISGSVITMEQWNSIDDFEAEGYETDENGNYVGWVYDADGWAYWSQAIAPGEATGLLLTAINDQGLIDEDYYYAIHVTGQFITAGDLKDGQYGGFYADPAQTPSDAALALLDTIGVKVGEDDGNNSTEYEATMTADLALHNTWDGGPVTEGSLYWDEERNAYIYTGDAEQVFIHAVNAMTLEGDELVDNGNENFFHDFELTGILTETEDNTGNGRFWYKDAEGNNIIESYTYANGAVFFRDRFEGEQEFNMIVKYYNDRFYSLDSYDYISAPIKIIMTGTYSDEVDITILTGGEDVDSVETDGHDTLFFNLESYYEDVTWSVESTSGEGEYNLSYEDEEGWQMFTVPGRSDENSEWTVKAAYDTGEDVIYDTVTITRKEDTIMLLQPEAYANINIIESDGEITIDYTDELISGERIGACWSDYGYVDLLPGGSVEYAEITNWTISDTNGYLTMQNDEYNIQGYAVIALTDEAAAAKPAAITDVAITATTADGDSVTVTGLTINFIYAD